MPTLCTASSLHKMIHLAPCRAKPFSPAIMDAWKDVLPVLGLAPTSIRCPSFTPSILRVKLGMLKVQRASKSFLASRVSIDMSAHSTFIAGMKSSLYLSNRLRKGSRLVCEPFT